MPALPFTSGAQRERHDTIRDDIMRERFRRFLIWIAWVPPVGWVSLNLYLHLTNRWGAFAAAPFIIAVINLSIAVGASAGVLWVWGAFHRRWDPALAFAAALAGSVALYASMHP
jgi:hypothetical protein